MLLKDGMCCSNCCDNCVHYEVDLCRPRVGRRGIGCGHHCVTTPALTVSSFLFGVPGNKDGVSTGEGGVALPRISWACVSFPPACLEVFIHSLMAGNR